MQVRALAFSPDGMSICVGGEDAKVTILEVASQKELGVAYHPGGKVLCAAWQGGLLAFAGSQDALQVVRPAQLWHGPGPSHMHEGTLTVPNICASPPFSRLLPDPLTSEFLADRLIVAAKASVLEALAAKGVPLAVDAVTFELATSRRDVRAVRALFALARAPVAPHREKALLAAVSAIPAAVAAGCGAAVATALEEAPLDLTGIVASACNTRSAVGGAHPLDRPLAWPAASYSAEATLAGHWPAVGGIRAAALRVPFPAVGVDPSILAALLAYKPSDELWGSDVMTHALASTWRTHFYAMHVGLSALVAVEAVAFIVLTATIVDGDARGGIATASRLVLFCVASVLLLAEVRARPRGRCAGGNSSPFSTPGPSRRPFLLAAPSFYPRRVAQVAEYVFACTGRGVGLSAYVKAASKGTGAHTGRHLTQGGPSHRRWALLLTSEPAPPSPRRCTQLSPPPLPP